MYMDGHHKPQLKEMHNNKGEQRHFPHLVLILVELLLHNVILYLSMKVNIQTRAQQIDTQFLY